MQKRIIFTVLTIISIVLLTACQAPAQTATAAPSYTDPFAYCAAVGTLSTIDGRYAGEAVPDAVIEGYLKAANLENSSEPMEQLRASTFWRCMGGSVYACNVGANLPCQSKANTDTNPTSAMNDYCASNPDSTFIPASTTGHETIYSWKCQGKTAVTDQQIDQADAEGFLTSIWYKIN